MTQKFSNNARTVLAAGITASDTSLSVQSGDGDLFPVADTDTGPLPSENDWFKLFITDVSGQIEIVGVRTRAGGSDVMSNVVRALDGTTARIWGVGAVAYQAFSADDLVSAISNAEAALLAAQEAETVATNALALVSGGSIPPGVVAYWPAATPPVGWLIRNGQAVSRTDHPLLFALIGTDYGIGDGTTTFNLPNDVTNNRFIRASGGALAVGAIQAPVNLTHTHAASTGSTGAHTHTQGQVGAVASGSYNLATGGVGINIVSSVGSSSANTSSAGSHAHTVSVTSSGDATENRPFSRAYLPIIKGG